MTRAAAIALLVLGACDVGSVLVNNGTPDGGTGCVNAATPGATHLHVAGGTPNQGQICLVSGCHLAASLGAGANPFAFAGTLYTTAAGTTIATGATVKVAFGTTTLTATTDADGNFTVLGTLTFPATSLATECPSLKPMVASLGTGGGNCNNCHRLGGTTSPMFLQ